MKGFLKVLCIVSIFIIAIFSGEKTFADEIKLYQGYEQKNGTEGTGCRIIDGSCSLLL